MPLLISALRASHEAIRTSLVTQTKPRLVGSGYMGKSSYLFLRMGVAGDFQPIRLQICLRVWYSAISHTVLAQAQQANTSCP